MPQPWESGGLNHSVVEILLKELHLRAWWHLELPKLGRRLHIHQGSLLHSLPLHQNEQCEISKGVKTTMLYGHQGLVRGLLEPPSDLRKFKPPQAEHQMH